MSDKNTITVVESKCPACKLIEIHKMGWAFCPWCGERKPEAVN